MKALMYKSIIENKLNILLGTFFTVLMLITNQTLFLFMYGFHEVPFKKYFMTFGFSKKELILSQVLKSWILAIYYILIILLVNLILLNIPVTLPDFLTVNIYNSLLLVNIIIIMASCFTISSMSFFVFNKVHNWITFGTTVVLLLGIFALIANDESFINRTYPLQLLSYSIGILIIVSVLSSLFTWVFMEKFDDVKY